MFEDKKAGLTPSLSLSDTLKRGIIKNDIISFNKMKKILITLFVLILINSTFAQNSIRKSTNLNNNWITIADSISELNNGFEKEEFDTNHWKKVNIPHNWDRYEGYRRDKHGNRHGCSWYRKYFTTDPIDLNKRYFLFFEGVGSYATVYVNGIKVGYHAGGRTTFTIDITDAIHKDGQENLLAVIANHPSGIRDLPWVCGGCSDEWGFSEGSQPFGIFRPVHLIETSDVRVEPFGIHAWNDTDVNEQSAIINLTTEIKNYTDKKRTVIVINKLKDESGNVVAETTSRIKISAGEQVITPQQINIIKPRLWSIEDPYLYEIVTELSEKGTIIDQTETRYGIRWISWPQNRNDGSNQFSLNGKPVFLNGTAEYEHNMGKSHAFSSEQIDARVSQVKAAGYNAFRDAHQPHNLRYNKHWDSLGLLWWPQMAAHIWFDTPEFKTNFKNLLHDWIKERRNSPSIILWGLENESTLPTDFAKECSDIIREMDPTTSSQRLITTCNGGTGTDWNVIQNWSGTYSGDPYNYDKEISQQLLNGEYGAWRSIDLHTGGGFKQNGEYSEDRMTQLMEMKIRLAESVRDKCCGQFHWPFVSHENPGRIQNGEGYRDIDRLGPINYKGLFTPWGEPMDAFYMYRSNYVDKNSEPMVYIASHTWPNRYLFPGVKDSIIVYSNCDEVELFNDVYSHSSGKLKHGGIGTHFTFNNVNIQYNVLSAIGYVDGKPVAKDLIILNHLPKSANFNKLLSSKDTCIAPIERLNYIYRVNCGGSDYIDTHGNKWFADVHLTDSAHWGSTSWTDSFEGLPHLYGSQRRTFDPISGTNDWKLLQTFRYGRDFLQYHFPVENGNYNVELFFIEPWYGTGGSLNCDKWRIFDIKVNDQLINDLDIWKQAGHDAALKLVVPVTVTNGKINISFPEVKAGQAVISAIAVSSKESNIQPASPSQKSIVDLKYAINGDDLILIKSWLDWGDKVWDNSNTEIANLPSYLFGSDWICLPSKQSWKDINNLCFQTPENADVYMAIDTTHLTNKDELNKWAYTKTYIQTDENGGFNYPVYTKRINRNTVINISQNLPIVMIAANPVTTMDKASDQRPVIKYELNKADIMFNQHLDSVDGRTFVHFCRHMSPQINWNITTGIADKYTIGIKYNNSTNKVVKARMRIETSTGIAMMDQTVEFVPNGEEWKTFRISTPSTINAGHYVVKLFSTEPTELKIDYLEIQ